MKRIILSLCLFIEVRGVAFSDSRRDVARSVGYFYSRLSGVDILGSTKNASGVENTSETRVIEIRCDR